MLSLVADWKASGLSQRAFSELHDINIATLGYWVAKAKELDSVTNGFIALPHDSSNKDNQVEILYPSGVRLKVRSDLALIAQLIRL